MSKVVLLGIVFASLGVATGCGRSGPPIADVTGTVMSCEGKPAAGGVLIFTPVGSDRKPGEVGRNSMGVVQADGTFTLMTSEAQPSPGAVIGKHFVTFQMPPTKKPQLLEGEKAVMPPEDVKKIEAEFATRQVYRPLPCSALITPSEVTITAGENKLEFTLPRK